MFGTFHAAYGQSEVLHGIDLSKPTPAEIVAHRGAQRHGQVDAAEIAHGRLADAFEGEIRLEDQPTSPGLPSYDRVAQAVSPTCREDGMIFSER
jgi:ABC-type branched-subunit amino acid transport system ATPase component